MSMPLPFRKPSARERARQDWIDERRREARMVVADVAHHSDHIVRLACNVLVQHGETPREREDARILLVVLDTKSPMRSAHHRSDGGTQAEGAQGLAHRLIALLGLDGWLPALLPWIGATVFLAVVYAAWRARAARIDDHRSGKTP